jgi:RHS repeat-associated protein
VVNQRNTYHNQYEYIDGTHMIQKIGDSYFGNTQDFKYDSNGNTIMHKDEYRMHEMSWDEQDRLKALSDADNGLYQYYMYDDKGERTIKYSLTGGSQLYQNGALVDPGSISIDHYKLYPNSYIVVTSDGQYTKNYFEGTTRFASRIEPHNDIFIPTTIKAPNKDAKEIDPVKDFRTYLQKMEIGGAVASELGTAKAPPGMGGQPGLYYLHTDHLGTASFVTDDNSETTQFFLNLPFGETMMEQQSGVYDNPYKFNAKELDSETGLYYYGARYYNPRVSVWYGVDPLAIFNPVMETQFYGDGQHNKGVFYLGNLNPYSYTYQNPIRYLDPNGKQVDTTEKRIIFTHGLLGGGSPKGGKEYWSNSFVNAAQKHTGASSASFTNVKFSVYSSAKDRFFQGDAYARENKDVLTKGLDKAKSELIFVTHSMGGAFGEGMAGYFKADGWNVKEIYHFSAFQAGNIDANSIKLSNGDFDFTTTFDIQVSNDPVIGLPGASSGSIMNADYKLREKSSKGFLYRHRAQIDDPTVWQRIKKLK